MIKHNYFPSDTSQDVITTYGSFINVLLKPISTNGRPVKTL